MSRMEVQTQYIDGRPHAKVRIAVAINASGQWAAFGAYFNDREASRKAVTDLARVNGITETNVNYVYALVPLSDDGREDWQ